MKNIIIGNWKMNLLEKDIEKYADSFKKLLKEEKINCDFGFAITGINLLFAKKLLENIKGVIISSQNCHYQTNGAFTGETSYTQLLEHEINYSIIGHSERRQYFNETDITVNKKVLVMLKNKMFPILCVGETDEERTNKTFLQVIESQIKASLNGVDKNDASKIIIAYEPIWAIGTGKSATSDDAEEMCAFIRKIIIDLFDAEVAQKIAILYGGSVNADNADMYFSQKNINGALVGGASLDPKLFFNLLRKA